MRRRAVTASVLTILTLLAGCGDGSPAPGPTETVTPDSKALADLPPLLVASEGRVRRFVDGRFETVGSVEGRARVAVDAGEEGVIVQRDFGTPPGRRSELMLLKAGGDPPRTQLNLTPDPQVHLHDAVSIDGVPHVLYDAVDPEAETETKGYLWLGDLNSGGSRKISEALGPEFGLWRASYGGGVIVTSATADLTEVVSFHRPDGTRVDRRSPTDDLPYNQPPLVTQAVFSPDGRLLAYLEGPDYRGESAERLVGSWEAVVQDELGNERVRIKVADRDECLHWLDFDGRWLVISRSAYIGEGAPCRPGNRSLPAIVLDTAEEDPAVSELGDVRGLATIVGGEPG